MAVVSFPPIVTKAGAWTEEKHPRGFHGRFTSAGGAHGIGPEKRTPPAPPEYQTKTSKGTFVNAQTYKTRLDSAQATLKDEGAKLTPARLEALYAHHDDQLHHWETNGNPDPVASAAMLNALREAADKRGLFFDQAGKLQTAKLPEVVVPTHHVLDAATGQTHDLSHPGLFLAGKEAAADKYGGMSNAELQAHYQAIDQVLRDAGTKENGGQAYHAAHLLEMHGQAASRGLHFDAEGRLHDEHGPVAAATAVPHPVEPTAAAAHAEGAVPPATHVVPAEILADPKWKHNLATVRAETKDMTPAELESYLHEMHGYLSGSLTDGMRRLTHARIVAIHEEAAKRGMYVGTDAKLHENPTAAAPAHPGPPAVPVPHPEGAAPADYHVVPPDIVAHPQWEGNLNTARAETKALTPEGLGEYLQERYQTLATAHTAAVIRLAHARIVAVHEEAANRGMYVGTDHQLHEIPAAAGAQHTGVAPAVFHVPHEVSTHPTWATEYAFQKKTVSGISGSLMEDTMKDAHHDMQTFYHPETGALDIHDHAVIQALHDEAATRGLYFGVDHTLHPLAQKPAEPAQHQPPAGVIAKVEHVPIAATSKLKAYTTALGKSSAIAATADVAHLNDMLGSGYQGLATHLAPAERARDNAVIVAVHNEAENRGMYVGADHQLHEKPAGGDAALPLKHELPEAIEAHPVFQTTKGYADTYTVPGADVKELDSYLAQAHARLRDPKTDATDFIRAHALLSSIHEEAAGRGLYVGADHALHDLPKAPTAAPPPPAAAAVPKAEHVVPEDVKAHHAYDPSVALFRGQVAGLSKFALEGMLANGHQGLASALSDMGRAVNHAKIQAVHEEAAKHGMYVGTDQKLHPETAAPAAPAAAQHPLFQHTVPEHIAAMEHYQQTLPDERKDAKASDQQGLQDMLSSGMFSVNNAPSKNYQAEGHARIQAVKDEVAVRGWHIDANGTIHASPAPVAAEHAPAAAGPAAGGPVPAAVHAVPPELAGSAHYTAALIHVGGALSTETKADLEGYLHNTEQKLAQETKATTQATLHGVIAAIHGEAAKRGMYVGTDGTLHPLAGAASHATPAHLKASADYATQHQHVSEFAATTDTAALEGMLHDANAAFAHTAMDANLSALHATIDVVHEEAARRGLYVGTDEKLHPLPGQPGAAAPAPAHHVVPADVMAHPGYAGYHETFAAGTAAIPVAGLQQTASWAHLQIADPAAEPWAKAYAHAALSAIHAEVAKRGLVIDATGAIHSPAAPAGPAPAAAAAAPHALTHETPPQVAESSVYKDLHTQYVAHAASLDTAQLEHFIAQGYDHVHGGEGDPHAVFQYADGHAMVDAGLAQAAERGLYLGTDYKLHPTAEPHTAVAKPAPEHPATTTAGGAPKPAGHKITLADAREMRRLRIQEGWTHAQLVTHFGTSKGMVNQVLTYQKHREGPVAEGEKPTIHHAREIRYRAAHEQLSQAQLAKEYNLSTKQVWHILHGNTLKEQPATGAHPAPAGPAPAPVAPAKAPAAPPPAPAPPQPHVAAPAAVHVDIAGYLKAAQNALEQFKAGSLPGTNAAPTEVGFNSHAMGWEKDGNLFYQHYQAVSKAYGATSIHGIRSKLAGLAAEKTGGKLTAKDILAYQQDWNSSSTSHSSRAVQLALKDKFNLTGKGFDNVYTGDITKAQIARARVFVDAHMAVMGEVWQKLGVTHIHLVRGIGFSSEDQAPAGFAGLKVGQEKTLMYNERPAASYSRDDHYSNQFANAHSRGYIVGAVIPVNRIFGAGWDSMGTDYESEYVPVGGDMHVTVRRVT